MKCVYRESLDDTGDDYTVPLFFYPYSLLLGAGIWVQYNLLYLIIIILYYYVATGGLLLLLDTPPHPPPGGRGGGLKQGTEKTRIRVHC